MFFGIIFAVSFVVLLYAAPRLTDRRGAKIERNIGGSLNENDFIAVVSDFAREVKRGGAARESGINFCPASGKNVHRAYKIIAKKIASGQRVYEFEKWIYDNYYIIGGLGGFKSLKKLPMIGGKPVIVTLAERIIGASVDRLNSERVKSGIAAYTRIKSLTVDEVLLLKDGFRYAVFERLCKMAERVVILDLARKAAEKPSLNPRFLNRNSYLYYLFDAHPKDGSAIKAYLEKNEIDYAAVNYIFAAGIAESNAHTAALITYLLEKDAFARETVLKFSELHGRLTEDAIYKNSDTATKIAYLKRIARLAKKSAKSQSKIFDALRRAEGVSGVYYGELIFYYEKDLLNYLRGRGSLKKLRETSGTKCAAYSFAVFFTAAIFTAAAVLAAKSAAAYVLSPLIFTVFLRVSFCTLNSFLGAAVKGETVFGYDFSEVADENAVMTVISHFVSSKEQMEEAILKAEILTAANGGKNIEYALLVDLFPAESKTDKKDAEILDVIEKYSGDLSFFVRERTENFGRYSGRERKRGAVGALSEYIHGENERIKAKETGGGADKKYDNEKYENKIDKICGADGEYDSVKYENKTDGAAETDKICGADRNRNKAKYKNKTGRICGADGEYDSVKYENKTDGAAETDKICGADGNRNKAKRENKTEEIYGGFRIVKRKPRKNKTEYFIFLDADNELLPGGAIGLVNRIAHPLNSRFDMLTLSARYNMFGAENSYKTRFKDLSGIESYPYYSGLFSRVFQREVFSGKGIARADAFYKKLYGLLPRNRVLSHDVIEGAVLNTASGGIVTFEDAPKDFKSDIARYLRWSKGDVLLLTFLKNSVKDADGKPRPLKISSFYKTVIAVNAAGILYPLGILSMLAAGYFLNIPALLFAAFGASFLNTAVDSAFNLAAPRVRMPYKLKAAAAVFLRDLFRLLTVPFFALKGVFVYFSTAYHLLFREEKVLEWKTFYETQKENGEKNALCRYILPSLLMTTGFAVLDFFVFSRVSAALAALLYTAAFFVYASGGDKKKNAKAKEGADFLTECAEKTYGFFKDNLECNPLICDNVQTEPYLGASLNTSPTNIGFSMLAVLSDYYIGIYKRDKGVDREDLLKGAVFDGAALSDAVQKIEKITAAVEGLEKWRGHLYNWYAVKDGKILPPPFVSSVDSANFTAAAIVVKEFLDIHTGAASVSAELKGRMKSLYRALNALVDGADFSRLYDYKRNLFYIGFDASSKKYAAHYDLLASESRILSYLGSVNSLPCWFKLGRRAAKPYGNTLYSWSGTMFEYLMADIFLSAPKGTLLFNSSRNAARVQRRARCNGVFGLSESGYYRFDDGMKYQYRAFGVNVLSLKSRSNECVISPYSSFLALKHLGRGAIENLLKLKDMGMTGGYGYFEAMDFLEKKPVASYMAHHQGMIMCAAANYLTDDIFCSLFMRDKKNASGRQLLTEKNSSVKPSKSVKKNDFIRRETAPAAAYFCASPRTRPVYAVLSNGRYNILADDSGRAFSAFGSVRVTREAESIADVSGKFLYIENLSTGGVYCPTYAPLFDDPNDYTAEFFRGKCVYTNKKRGCVHTVRAPVGTDGELHSFVIKNDGEAAAFRLSFFGGDIVLGDGDAYMSHKAFYNMFINVERERENYYVVKRKKTRENGAEYYAAMFVKGISVCPEFNRFDFIGRGRTLKNPIVTERKKDGARGCNKARGDAKEYRNGVEKEENKSGNIFEPQSGTVAEFQKGNAIKFESESVTELPNGNTAKTENGNTMKTENGNTIKFESGNAEFENGNTSEPRNGNTMKTENGNTMKTESGGKEFKKSFESGGGSDGIGGVIEPCFGFTSEIFLKKGEKKEFSVLIAAANGRAELDAAIRRANSFVFDKLINEDPGFIGGGSEALTEKENLILTEILPRIIDEPLRQDALRRAASEPFYEAYRNYSGNFEYKILYYDYSGARGEDFFISVLKVFDRVRGMGIKVKLIVSEPRIDPYHDPVKKLIKRYVRDFPSVEVLDEDAEDGRFLAEVCFLNFNDYKAADKDTGSVNNGKKYGENENTISVREVEKYGENESVIRENEKAIRENGIRKDNINESAIGVIDIGKDKENESAIGVSGGKKDAESGGFLKDSREAFRSGAGYFTTDGGFVVEGTDKTRLPYSNVAALPDGGFVATENGGGFSFFFNSRENKVSVMSNDPVSDTPSERLFLSDGSRLFRLNRGGKYTEHKNGLTEFYNEFKYGETAFDSRLLEYPAKNGRVKIFETEISNRSGKSADFTLFLDIDPALSYRQNKDALIYEYRADRVKIKNASNNNTAVLRVFGGETIKDKARLTDRTGFIYKDCAEGKGFLYNGFKGESGGFPHREYGEKSGFDAALNTSLKKNESGGFPHREYGERNGFGKFLNKTFKESGNRGVGGDSDEFKNGGGFLGNAFAVKYELSLRPGKTKKFFFVLSADEELPEDFEPGEIQEEKNKTLEYFSDFNNIKICTGDKYLDTTFNHRLLYQVVSSRLNGRCGYYQAGGAIGFRDQLQDVLALVHSRPDILRGHILLCAARQYEDGGVMHWWHGGGPGVRTKISDDKLFLPYCAFKYIAATGDYSILDEKIPYLVSPPLMQYEQSRMEIPEIGKYRASLLDHIERAIESALQYGSHDLLLIGAGDWNDALDAVGTKGIGESVWLSMFAYEVLKMYKGTAAENRLKYIAHELRLKKAVNTHGFDGDRFKRAYTDDGGVLGSRFSKNCRIDLICQSYAAISGIASAERIEKVLNTAASLVDRENRIVKLFAPPFDGEKFYGYISSYPVGVRENGGQYTHAVMWYISALFKSGRADEAYEILKMINPAEIMSGSEKYMGEPYAVGADVSLKGKMGWNWYTGSAGLMYRVILEDMLGITLSNNRIRIKPNLPSAINFCKVEYKHKKCVYNIEIKRRDGEKFFSINGMKIKNHCGIALKEEGNYKVEVFV
ncbi:MAG: hypothetical protein LBP62_01625 [Clostridiales bacterium]|jgi:cellobiose phosphorylase|nr:hypothetical protein [Clostridiales bacterium]